MNFKRFSLVIFSAFVLVGCGRITDWVGGIVDTKIPNQVIAYDTKKLVAAAEPELTIKFKIGSTALDTIYLESLTRLANSGRFYIVEGTAGGVRHVELAMERALAVAGFLEEIGVANKDIALAEYNPKREGGRVHVYSIEQ